MKSFIAILKRWPLAAALSISVVAAGIVGATGLIGAAQARDCDDIAIMRCGAYSVSEFNQKYNENQPGDLPGIYQHYGVDITKLAGAKSGYVTKEGDVFVDGKKVATGGRTITRVDKPGSTPVVINGKTYFERDTRYFAHNYDAFVFFDQHGRFLYAVLKDCGNPLTGTPTQPKPSLVCESLKASAPINRTTFRFTATATAKDGAAVTGYTFDFGDGTTKQQTEATISHTYTTPGTYTVAVTIHSTIGDVKDAKCKVTVTVDKPPVKDIKVCDLATKKYPVTIKEDQFNPEKHSKNPKDCEATPPVVTTITVCDLAIKKYPVTIKESEFDATKHSTNPDDCKETPVTPPQELPTTGVSDVLLQLLGLGSITAATLYYALSATRRS